MIRGKGKNKKPEIHDGIVRWFYDDVGDEDEYTKIAKEIWEAWIASIKNVNCNDW